MGATLDDEVMPSQVAAQPATMDDEVLPSQRGAAVNEDVMPSLRDEVMPSARSAPVVIQRPGIDPNAPGGFNYAGKQTRMAPGTGLGEELSDLTEPIGRQLNTAGNVLRGGLADIGTLPVDTGDAKFRNTTAAWNGEAMPMDAESKLLPTPVRVVNAGVQGLIKTAPNLALTALNPVAGAASFGMTPDGFDMKQAVMAAALPLIGKYTGAITEALAGKLGVTKDAALNIWNRIGGATGAAGTIGADQLRSILKLPEDQRKDALIEAAGNIGSMFVLGAMGERTKLSETGAGKLVNKLRGPTEADGLENELGAASKQSDETLPSQRKPFNPNLSTDLSLLSDVMDDQHRQLMGAKIAADRAAARADQSGKPSEASPEPVTIPNSQPTPPPAEVATATPEASPAPATPLIPVDVTEEEIKAAAKTTGPDHAHDVLDEIAQHTRGPVQFAPEQFGNKVNDARQNTFTPKGRPSAATKRLDERMSASEGTPADEVLKGLAEENPKYANWTPDDLAEAMINAHTQRENAGAGKLADARQLVEDQKRTQLFEGAALRPRAKGAPAEPVPAHELFVGDTFKLNGQPVKVEEQVMDAETGQPSHVRVSGAYGDQTIPARATVQIDKGSLESPALLDKLEALKLNTNGQLHAFGLGPVMWNMLIDGVKLGVRGGMKLKDAIDAAFAKLNAAGQKWEPGDEASARAVIAAEHLPPVVLPNDDTWLKGNRINDARAREIGRRLQGTTVENTDTGWRILFNSEGIIHTLHDARTPEHFQSVEALPKLVASSKHIFTEADTENRPNIKAFHTLANKLQIGDKVFSVKLKIKEMMDGTKFYDHELFPTERPADSTAGLGAGGSASAPSPGYSGQPSETTNNSSRSQITPADNTVKPNNIKPGETGTLDKAQAAIEQRLGEIRAEGRLRALGDPEVLGLHVARGAVILAKGARDFAGWSAEMIRQIGDEVKPHLQKIWDIVHDRNAETGLSARGVKILADQAIDAGVRDKINPVYQKLTDRDAKDQAQAIGANYATAGELAQDLLKGKFKDAPGGIEVALLAHTARRLAEEQKLAEKQGDQARSDSLAQAQIDLLNRYREQSTDIAQALQKHQLLYENFSPAAWLKNFRDLVGKVASRRVEQAGSLPQGTVEPTPHAVAQGIAAQIAKDLELSHPKLAQAIREFFANPPGGTLADYLKAKGLAEAGKADAAARKLEKFYSDQVAKWRKRNNIPQFDAATEKEVLRRATAVDALPRDSVQRATATQDLHNWLATQRGFEWWEPAREFWYANVLSGLTTAEKIFRSNALSMGAEIGVQMLRHPTAIPQILEAAARSLPRSTAEAWRITKTGVSGRPGDVFDHSSWMETRTGLAAALVFPWKMVFRTHHSLHAITYYPLEETKALVLSREAAKREGVPVFGGALGKAAAQKMQWLGEQRRDAQRQAQAEGLKPGGPLYSSRVDQILSQRRDKTVMINAQQFAQMGTYVNDMYGMLGAAGDQFNKFAQNYPVARLVQPFVKIPINLFNGMLNWTPVGAYRAARGQGFKLLIGREDNTGKLYGREVTDPTAIGDLYAKATIGTLATVGLMSAASAFVNDPNPPFMVTARGPNDPNHRRLLEQAGWIPNSIKVGNTYIPYLDTPAGVVLAYIGHNMDALRYNKLDHEDALSRAMFAASSIRSVIFDSTWAQGLSAMFDTGSYRSNKNLGEKGVQQAVRTASGFVVPNILKQLDQIYDPKVYKADDIEAMIMTQTPFARSHGEPDLNVFGESVLNPLSNRIISRVQGSPLIQALAGRRIWPSMPLEPDLTPAEQRLMLKVRGPQLQAKLQAQLPMIQALPQKEAQILVNNISRKTTEDAKQQLGFANLLRIQRAAKR